MTGRIDTYTIGELANASGVSVRTLHHYDALGLLKPASVAENGYRNYGRAEALRLQEILFYRDLGMPLAEIAAVLRTGQSLDRLVAHRARLDREADRLAEVLATLDATIAHLKGEHEMTLDALYTPFGPEKQAAYEEWLIDTYGGDLAEQIAQAREAVTAAGGAEPGMEALRGIEADLVAAFEGGAVAGARDVRPLLNAHRDWVASMWGRDCDLAAYAGLAELYASHPDFIARYEALAPGFSVWLPEAMRAYAT